MDKEAQISANEMTQYRERLTKQKEFLTDILSKIEKQILALQVERLHLRNTLLGTDPTQEAVLNTSEQNISTKTDPITENVVQELDLSMPSFLNNSEEENEDEESTIDIKDFFVNIS